MTREGTEDSHASSPPLNHTVGSCAWSSSMGAPCRFLAVEMPSPREEEEPVNLGQYGGKETSSYQEAMEDEDSDKWTEAANEEMIKSDVQKLKEFLKSEFTMKNIGNAKKVLGMEIERNRQKGCLWISQEGYLRRAVSNFYMDQAKSMATSMGAHFSLKSATGNEFQ
ncbi:hypothetical protein Bca52824_065213 [Brassica carinata]|uniref:Reverse transcriptase Ty1/copia-type domain-containing protein n=1 Tax=Brassica carinata TaxID=52824 RepID=A0A8X7QJA4_BRACI|nr:hypothetical protein Bca52824_065213 [Brassica carinata]